MENPAAQLALAWFHAGNGIGAKNMVILPYKDQLELFSKYLQQLVMESLGKAKDLAGKIVHQGICVFGNKGSTDQHAYVQQLRDGINNFFVTFIEVLKDREGASGQVEPGIVTGDFLLGFLLGTRSALYDGDRESVTITVKDVSAFSIGVLIALFERTVGFYATLIGINAYHQPGVEAGKKAASDIISLEAKIIKSLSDSAPGGFTADKIATLIAAAGDVESVFKICEHLAANSDRRIVKELGQTPFEATYKKV